MVTCSLLPRPDNKMLRSRQGRLSDMDECFRNNLTTYISDLVGNIWRHIKTTRNGQPVSCHRLAGILKQMVDILQNEEYSFASPMQLHYSFENYKAMQQCKEQFQNALKAMEPKSFSPIKILKMSPSDMEAKVRNEANAMLRECGKSLQGIDDEKKRRHLADLQSQLDLQQNLFCTKYSKIHTAVKTGCIVGGTMLSVAGVVAGGAAGAAVAGAVIAGETVGGAMGGSVLLGTIGTGLGSIGGKLIGLIRSKMQQCEGETTDESGQNSSQS
ncbi:hypothetical protein XENTR_v10023382 [Xenopus tropicalis]|nr:hypothetical protein XENTR_v10023382 [Xenopus tropicalis]